MTSKKSRIPRGIRNNNPLNIRVGNNWKGEVSHPTDHTFEQFTEMKWGVRAAFIVLKNYIVRHGCNTVRKIITRWAPPNENKTQNYIKQVCKIGMIEADAYIDFNNPCTMIRLFSAMCFVENGQSIEVQDVIAGYELAMGKTVSV